MYVRNPADNLQFLRGWPVTFLRATTPNRRLMNRANTIGAMTVLDEQATAIRLDSLWRDRPAALVFVRHFG